MNMGDYVASEDVRALTDAEYAVFLDYVRFLGYNVWNGTSDRYTQIYSEVMALGLDSTGDVAWVRESWLSGHYNRISLEEVKRMASMMNSV